MDERKPVIAVDVDLTVVDTGQAWYDWLEANAIEATHYEEMFDNDGKLPYNLAQHYTMPEGVDAFDFWRLENLYDEAVCYESAKVVLEHLYKKGWEIVWISWCFDHGQHAESKANMLRREFSFIEQKDFHFCQTKSKGIFSKSFDYFIDDRSAFINEMDESVVCFQINTPYTQDEELTRPVFTVDSWDEIINLLEV
ncbi:unknown function [Vibrio phage K406]